MQIVVFFSYKGGVGRSLTLCNTAASLCRKHCRVGLLDFDVDAPSLHYQLDNVLPEDWKFNDYSPDILSLLRTDNKSITPKAVQEASVELRLPVNDGSCILIPCFGREKDIEALDSKETDWSTHLSSFKKICEMFDADPFNLDYLLIDARTGYSKQAILASYIAQQIVIVTKADKVSLMGNKMMLDMFNQNSLPTHLIVTNVPTTIKEDDERLVDFVKKLEQTGSEIYFPYVPDWYFEGAILWEVAPGDSVISGKYDDIAAFLMGVK